jgi:hypothetical protein
MKGLGEGSSRYALLTGRTLAWRDVLPSGRRPPRKERNAGKPKLDASEVSWAERERRRRDEVIAAARARIAELDAEAAREAAARNAKRNPTGRLNYLKTRPHNTESGKLADALRGVEQCLLEGKYATECIPTLARKALGARRPAWLASARA